MKKSTLALLLPLALSANLAAAQESNVTISGVIDVGFAKTSGQTTVQRENQAPRLTFKGTENLGGGLSAFFILENQFQADTGAQTGNLFDRAAQVGLKGDFGTVALGRTKDLYESAFTRIDPFISSGVIGKVVEPIMRARVSASRASNAITYNSPNMQGLVISGQYILAEVSGGKNGYALLGTYDQGPISLQAAYESAPVATANTSQPNVFMIGGGFMIDSLKLTASYNKGKTKTAAGDFDGWVLGANYKFGAQADLKAVYARQKQSTTTDKITAREFGIGVDYHMSKRTDLYAYAGRESVAALNSIQMGITHKF